MEDVGSLKVSLGLDSAEFTQRIQDINRKLKAVTSEFKSAGDGTKKWQNSLEGMNAKLDSVNRRMELQREKVKSLKQRYDEISAAQGKNSKAAENLLIAYNQSVAAMNRMESESKQLTSRINEQSNGFTQLSQSSEASLEKIATKMRLLQSRFQATTAGMSDLTSEAQKLQQKSELLTNTLQLQEQEVEQLKRLYKESARAKGADSQETQELAIRYNQALASMRQTESELSRTTREIEEQSSAWNRLRTRMQNVGERFQDVGGRMQSVGSEISQSFGVAFLAVGGALGLSAKKAMDFESQMSSVKSVMSPAEVNQFGDSLEKLAVKMGADTKYSAIEAAQGIEELIKAGVSVSDIMNGGLEGALSLATAGELELADAAEIASTALNAFKDDNISVTRAADLLAGAANASATSVSEMKFGLSAVSAVASGVGLSFEDTSTALATFANNGLKGSDAGTSLKTMLMNLTPKTDAQIGAFEQLGLGTMNVTAGYNYLVKNGMNPATKTVGDVTEGLMKMAKEMAGSKASTEKQSKEFDKLAKTSGFASSAFYDQNGNIKSMAEIAGILQKSLNGLNSEQRQTYLYTMFGSDAIRAANILYKEGSQGVSDMATAMNKIKSADVAAEKLNNVKGKIEQLKGTLETAAISIGNSLLPAIEKVVAVVQTFTDKFNGLSPKMQSFITIGAVVSAAIFGIVTAMGVLLTVVGGAISGLGAIAGALGIAGGAAGLFGSALAVLTGPIGLTTAAIAGIGIASYKIAKDMRQSSIEVDLFGNNVSNGTQKAVGSFMKLSDSATVALNQLSFSGQAVSSKMATDITNNFDRMGEQIKSSLQKKGAEQLSMMQEFFSRSSALTDKEEKGIVAKIQQSQNEQQKAIEQGQQRVKQILEKARNEKRSITDKERAEINQIQEKMTQAAVKTLTANQREQKVILERMKAEASDISAKQAAEVVKNSVKQKNTVVKDANEQYNKAVAAIIKQRDEAKTISADQANKLIADAKRQRDNTVKHAQEMHNKVVSQAKQQAKGHVDQINWETGQVLSKWEIFKNNVGTKFSNIKAAISKKLEEMKKDTQQKWESMKTTASKKVDEMKTSISNKMAEVKAKIQAKWKEAESFFKSIDLTTIGKNIIEGLINGISGMMGQVKQKIKDVADAVTGGLKRALDIHSPSRKTHKIGEETGQGFANGIAAKKKEAEKQAKKNAEAAKKKFSESIGKAQYNFKMGKINSSEYITELRRIQREYAKTPEQVRQVNLTIKSVQEKQAKDIKAIQQKSFQDAFKLIKDKAAAGKISTDQEIKQLQALANKYKVNSKERLAVEVEIKKAKDKLLKEQENRLKASFEKEKAIIEKKKYYNQLSLEDELKMYEENVKKYKKGTEQREYYEREIYRVKQDLVKEQFDKEKNLIDKKKYYNELSLTEELAAYEEYIKKYKQGSDERAYYEKEIYRVKKEINDQLTKINDEYTEKVKQANQRLIDSEKQLNEEYQKSVDDRAKTLYSFVGLFDEVKQESDVTGQQLVENLKGQVDTFKNWQSNISQLTSKGILSDALMQELQNMGPQASAEIAALTSLTDEELKEYADLWKEKNSLATSQATQELEGMKAETQVKIKELREQTTIELDAYKDEWATKIAEISKGSTNEFSKMTSSMKDIGVNSMKGLMNGLSSMTEPLLKQAQEIADAIAKTMQQALDIHSPSRKTTWLGKMTGEGFAVGMNESKKLVTDTANKLAQAALPDVNAIASRMVNTARGVNNKGASSLVDNVGKTVVQPQNILTQNVTINSSAMMNPSEIARQNKLLMQQLAFKMR
ncbi:phage tail tape measure protein [Priestia koreensis]|uniref:phage tail tape measure protein n=1 Tax=Priestia koreensis TaxID=284581 RepID=UPI003D050A41